MSLDYIFVKAAEPTKSIEELEEDKTFKLKDYKALGASLFPDIQWDTHNLAVLTLQGSLLEVEASGASLTVRVSGLGADPKLILKLARQCKDKNVVVIDVQTSELIIAKGAAQDMEQYKEWYRSVLGQYK
ncbi:MAG: hypothetical protein LBV44_00020 [Methylobacillus sp.]|nr:hypothetical protein [Methylobacillus sp.]